MRSKKGCMASGGSVYEKQMVGMKPSTTPHHYNYESQMKGEKHKKFDEGGAVKHIRAMQANSAGMPINSSGKQITKSYKVKTS